MRSDLEIPQQISKFLSLYLIFSIGLKGGVELSHEAFQFNIIFQLLVCILFSIGTTFISFSILKLRYSNEDSAAIAATYGSVSAVTFITAIAYIQELNEDFSGFMVAALALMEAPPIVVGVILYNRQNKNMQQSIGGIVKESLLNGSVILIIASIIAGWVAEPKSLEEVKIFSEDLFKGVLTFFLLDMGLVAGKRLKYLKGNVKFTILFSIATPLFNSFLAIGIAYLMNFAPGDAFLFSTLAAGASYIAVPAAMRIAIPKANPGTFVPMALAITFPFNILLGLPFYHYLIQTIF